MEQFYTWLTKPMTQTEVDTWYKANNIQPELTELFKDFCFSLYNLVISTYLGDSHGIFNETKIGVTVEDNKQHFIWCWEKTIQNFKKENIKFKFDENDFDYFQSFFFEVYYDQTDENVRNDLKEFIIQLFNRKRPVTKSDIEMFTDVYKILERSLIF
jgi:hypothetical protein